MVWGRASQTFHQAQPMHWIAGVFPGCRPFACVVAHVRWAVGRHPAGCWRKCRQPASDKRSLLRLFSGLLCVNWLWLATPADTTTAADLSTAREVTLQTLTSDFGRILDLAVAPNGQKLFALTREGTEVVVLESGRNADGGARVVLEGVSPDGPGLAVGCLDTGVLAVLRQSNGPTLTTHRVAAGGDVASDAANPLQRVTLASDEARQAPTGGEPDGSIGESPARLMISPSRDWLAVSTSAAGPPALFRAAIAGIRVGSLSTRNTPQLKPEEMLLAVGTGPSDELAVVTTSDAAEPSRSAATLSMYATPGGRQLLRLETDLRAIRDVGLTSPSGTLWVLTEAVATSEPPQPAGLWRLTTVLRDRRPAIEPVLVTTLEAPRALAGSSDEVLYAALNGGDQLVEIRPAAPPDAPAQ